MTEVDALVRQARATDHRIRRLEAALADVTRERDLAADELRHRALTVRLRPPSPSTVRLFIGALIGTLVGGIGGLALLGAVLGLVALVLP